MKIQPPNSGYPITPKSIQQSIGQPPSINIRDKQPQISFLETLKRGAQEFNNSINKVDLATKNSIRGVSTATKELLSLQVRSGEMLLKCELVSKVAESGNSVIKKITGGGA